jgi:hypothetical protein
LFLFSIIVVRGTSSKQQQQQQHTRWVCHRLQQAVSQIITISINHNLSKIQFSIASDVYVLLIYFHYKQLFISISESIFFLYIICLLGRSIPQL